MQWNSAVLILFVSYGHGDVMYFEVSPMVKIKKIFRLLREGKLRFALSKRFANKNLKRNLKLIDRRLSPYLKRMARGKRDFDEEIPNSIFFFWYDGFECLPRIPALCLKHLKQNYEKEYQILLIDKNNLKEISSIDPFFTDLFEKGKISIQMYSDALRFTLLKNLGGYWVDSSLLFLSNAFNFRSLLKETSFNSVENGSIDKPFISYGGVDSRWCTFLLAGRKENEISSVYLDALKRYFSRYSHAPYLMTDILICLLVKYGFVLDYAAFGRTKISAYALTENENEKVETMDQGILSSIRRDPQKLINGTDVKSKNEEGILSRLLRADQSLNPFLK